MLPLSVLIALMVYGNRPITSFKNSTEWLLLCSSYAPRCLQREETSIAVYWKYRLPAMRPGTYFTSISISSPRLSFALRYLYLVFVAWYFRTNPSAFSILPTVRSWISMPCFLSFQCSLSAQSFFSLRSSMTCSFSRIGVSWGEVFGLVDTGSRASAPPFLYSATQRSSVLLPYGNTFAASTSRTSLRAMGSTHRSRPSKISCAIWTISGLYPKPPYVCAHYQTGLTLYCRFAIMVKDTLKRP